MDDAMGMAAVGEAGLGGVAREVVDGVEGEPWVSDGRKAGEREGYGVSEVDERGRGWMG